MVKRNIFTCIIFFIWIFNLNAQQNIPFSVRVINKKPEVTPGQIINLPFFVKNNLEKAEYITCAITAPTDWKVIAGIHGTSLNSGEEKLLLFSIQPPATTAVGNYQLKLFVVHTDNGDTLASHDFSIQVTEFENISMLLIQSPEFVYAGDTIKTKYLIQNLGNTTKKVFIETLNCDVVGSPEFEVEAGKSIQFDVQAETSADLIDTKREYYTVRAILSGEVKKSIYRSVTVFPSKKGVKDLYFRFPVTANVTYVASNYGEQFQKGYQFQLEGQGPLDPQGKHQLQFMARGPNLSRLSYLGLYDQYFISYSNKNAELFVGEKAFSVTPLTE